MVINCTDENGRYIGVCIMDGEIYYEGKRLPPLPNKSIPSKVAFEKGRLVINDFEWKNGHWVKHYSITGRIKHWFYTKFLKIYI